MFRHRVYSTAIELAFRRERARLKNASILERNIAVLRGWSAHGLILKVRNALRVLLQHNMVRAKQRSVGAVGAEVLPSSNADRKEFVQLVVQLKKIFGYRDVISPASS